ncbi:phosphopantetheine adenylyltransferase, putative [Entamoeba dispar SAW760]|uniref:Phosphopantetheine adenylyltransferase, putative n=1 Tax=Entamoeba dispar (strain ATCC PRA-260 / SAW760) TaxID=370354 RepID=B0EAZ0_ENTDS|nr:phosphopantetheine adenylyltransferase, putative [Entamoeba dispar SAW760]EDR28297.1 phosphopantetheine adenylyltransferase, putative [Entamoeba dispar SAW760]|eukprot:EDR28297.1 phosphopantetheine adenylyltransferase, putative [Entamoeba dispar SAW760]
MEIEIEETTQEEIGLFINSHPINNPLLFYLNSSSTVIPQIEYNRWLQLIYQILISIDESYSLLFVLLIPRVNLLPRYNNVGVGGTFDRLHCGHYTLIQTAVFTSSSHLAIAITGDSLLHSKQNYDLIHSFTTRKNQIIHLLHTINKYYPIPSYTISQINQPEGTSTTDPTLECLIVSDETQKSLPIINNQRILNGYLPLHSITINLILTTDGSKFSSSTLRSRERSMNKDQ